MSQLISAEEHERHIVKIIKAWTTDSQDNRDRLAQALKEAPFLMSVNNVTGIFSYKKPNGIYFRSPELEIYFKDNQEAWFINEDEGYEVWEQLGVVDQPRFLRFRPDLSWQQKSDLIGTKGHTNDISIDDFKLDGLEYFLRRLTIEDELDKKKTMIIVLWNYLISYFIDMSEWQKDRYFRGEYKWFYRTTHYAYFDSHWLRLIRENAWLPSPNGGLCRPAEISFDQLPPEFIQDGYLIKKIGFKPNEIEEIEELSLKSGVDKDVIMMLKNRPDLGEEVKRLFTQSEFPVRTDSGASEESFWEDIENAPEVEFTRKERSIRVSRGNIDPQTWLRGHYSNREGEMICQLCEKIMPFQKLDDLYYFESVEIIKGIKPELEEKFLALCPVCAAKYKYYVKGENGGKNAMQEIKSYILNNTYSEIPIRLDKGPATIRFVEVHYNRLKQILQREE